MALQFSTPVRNAMLDAIETAVGAAAKLKIRTGAAPANVTDPSTGTELAVLDLPSDWMGAAAAGQKDLAGTWEDTSADATGVAGHFEVTASDGTTVHMRGSVTATSGGGDMELDNTSIAAGQTVTVSQFRLTAANA